jgi:hypothetical protein
MEIEELMVGLQEDRWNLGSPVGVKKLCCYGKIFLISPEHTRALLFKNSMKILK